MSTNTTLPPLQLELSTRAFLSRMFNFVYISHDFYVCSLIVLSRSHESIPIIAIYLTVIFFGATSTVDLSHPGHFCLSVSSAENDTHCFPVCSSKKPNLATVSCIVGPEGGRKLTDIQTESNISATYLPLPLLGIPLQQFTQVSLNQSSLLDSQMRVADAAVCAR
jgi:hypothetical protein